jgi:hypothetical protein
VQIVERRVRPLMDGDSGPFVRSISRLADRRSRATVRMMEHAEAGNRLDAARGDPGHGIPGAAGVASGNSDLHRGALRQSI